MGRVWRVAGGEDTGGIIVREGRDLSSAKLPHRLSTGALVHEEELVGERLHFRRLQGQGPEFGWASLRLNHKELLVSHAVLEPPAPKPQPPPPPLPPPPPSTAITDWTNMSDDDWKERLSDAEYEILRERGTENAGSHEFMSFFPKEGYFECAGCGLPLYSSSAKFSDCGWPAWDKCYYSKEIDGYCHVRVESDEGLELLCKRCGGHLGHVFYGEQATQSNERH
mmetsp:Transcript_16687/g.35371  ORF Transcript_16687/g.35371 Transcript_16687/m.35371 type:complete len:224 (-) Transcript_16687:166-837(-)